MCIRYLVLALLLGTNVSFAATNYDYVPAVPSYPQTQYGQQSQQYYGNQIQQPGFGSGTSDYQRQYYNQQASAPNTAQTLKGHIVTVPAGQKIPVITMMSLSSENLYLGQNVTVALGSDYYFNGAMIAPAGSSISGQVLEVSKAKRGSINGKLMVRFTQIVLPNGTQIPISALIKTDDGSGVLVGGTKMDVAKDYAKDIAVGSAAGATAGLVMSAISDGKVGKGTAIGTAVGAGGGLVKSIWDKGENVEIPVNSTIELVLTQSITVNPAIYSTNY